MLNFDPQKHRRRSIRLKGYDYSQAGAYFVTLVAWQREMLFGEILNSEMQSNGYAKIVQSWWDELPVHFQNVETGAFVIMPNHVHGIIAILADGRDAVSASGVPTPNVARGVPLRGGITPPQHKPTLGQIIAYFKYQSTKEMNALDNSGTITKFWQRNYYEHIIRNEREMKGIWAYIEANPGQWEMDEENPERL